MFDWSSWGTERNVDFFSEFGCMLGGSSQGIRREIFGEKMLEQHISLSVVHEKCLDRFVLNVRLKVFRESLGYLLSVAMRMRKEKDEQL